jgi:hypothetical protein
MPSQDGVGCADDASAVDRHKEFAALIERAQARAERYDGPLKADKP